MQQQMGQGGWEDGYNPAAPTNPARKGEGAAASLSPSAAAATARPVGPAVEEKREEGAYLATPAAIGSVEVDVRGAKEKQD
jgi:hypothetical protein